MQFTNLKTSFLLAIILFAAIASFAQTERDKGIAYYRRENYAEAIRSLKSASEQKIYKTDAEVWSYLGLSLINEKKIKDGRKALEKAVTLAPQISVYRSNLAYAHLLERKTDKAQNEIKKAISLDSKNAAAFFIRGTANLWEDKNDRAVTDAEQAIALDPNFTAAYVLHSDGLLASFGDKWAENADNPQDDFGLLARADESLNRCLTNCPKTNALKAVADRVDTIRAFTDYFKRKSAPKNISPDASSQNKTPLKITYKPKPRYTADARDANESGDIRLAVFFGADGQTKYIIPLKGLRYGLTEQTIEAAKGIRFEPEKIDGKPISVVKVVVFNYKIY